MRAAALQFDVTADSLANREVVAEELRRGADQGVELVLLPEMWSSGFPTSVEERDTRVPVDLAAVEALRALSADLGLCVAGSSLASEDGELRNRFQVFDSGREILRYDKIHLFSPTAEHEVFGAGDEVPATVDSSVARLSGSVCYDLRFPEMFRVAYRQGVQVYLVPAQWPSPRATHWRALLIARAVENQCFVIGCNRTGEDMIGRRKMPLVFPGNSLIATPHGQVLAEGHGEVGLVMADLDLEEVRRIRTRVPVHKDERLDLYREWLDAD